MDYEAVKKNLHKVLEHVLKSSSKKVVLVYGDLCLGQNGEMKKLADEYGVVKVDAVNCIDCQLGGKGAFLEADPEHNLMFMGPGMIEFFSHMKEQMQKEGVEDNRFKAMFERHQRHRVFGHLRGDTEKCREILEKFRDGTAYFGNQENRT